MNLFDTALNKELEVKAYYEKMSAAASLQGIRTIFSLLAGDEQKHYEAILEMKASAESGLPSESSSLETAKDIVMNYIGDADAVSKMKNDVEGYLHALRIEAESVRFYESMLEKETEKKSIRVLSKILLQERNHYNIVENLYDFASEPQYFLAWGEFSNLRDL